MQNQNSIQQKIQNLFHNESVFEKKADWINLIFLFESKIKTIYI